VGRVTYLEEDFSLVGAFFVWLGAPFEEILWLGELYTSLGVSLRKYGNRDEFIKCWVVPSLDRLNSKLSLLQELRFYLAGQCYSIVGASSLCWAQSFNAGSLQCCREVESLHRVHSGRISLSVDADIIAKNRFPLSGCTILVAGRILTYCTDLPLQKDLCCKLKQRELQCTLQISEPGSIINCCSLFMCYLITVGADTLC
jgi:hypothetical protein